jgi:putative FmdB family regulatory protein
MPIYEYGCLDCGYTFEIKRMITEMDYTLICPTCKSSKIKRIFPTSFSYLRETNQNQEGERIKESKVPTAIVKRCSFWNVGTGIKTAGDAHVIADNLKMHNVHTVVEATENSNIEITNLNAKWNSN